MQVTASILYSSVAPRDSVIIIFLIGELNDLDIMMCEIGNASLNADTSKRMYFTDLSEW